MDLAAREMAVLLLLLLPPCAHLATLLPALQRKSTLLVEYRQLRKSNAFIDRRFGGARPRCCCCRCLLAVTCLASCCGGGGGSCHSPNGPHFQSNYNAPSKSWPLA